MATPQFGIFGPTPEQIRMAEQARREQTYAQQAQGMGAFGPLYQISRGLSSQGINMLGESLFPQAQSQQLQQATALQQLKKQYTGVDLSDPNNMMKLAKDLSSVGAVDQAMAVAKQAKSMMPKQEIFGKIDPKDYTPESIKTFAQTGDYASLVAKEKPNAVYRTLSPAEARARGLDPNMTYQLEEGTNKVSQIGQGPAVVFNAPLVGSEKEYAKLVGKSSAERDIAQFGSAEAATENLPKINETLNELRTSEALTGAFADIQKNIQKVQAKFAADKKAGKRVTDTEYLDALLGSDVFPMIGALGIGARGLDTPPEREFLRQVMTGTINLEKDTLIKLTELRKNVAERAINKFNARVDKGELDDFFKYRRSDPVKFEIPKYEPPAPKPTPVPSPTKPQQGSGWSIERIQ